MDPKKFVKIWESKHEILSDAHHDLMLEQLVGYNIRAIEEIWIREAIEVRGLKKLIEIIPESIFLQEQNAPSPEPVPISKVTIQGAPRFTAYRSQEVQQTFGELLALANSKNPDKRLLAAKSHQATMSILDQLSCDPIQAIREVVAKNTTCSYKVLAQLANDESPKVRTLVASNLRTPSAILEKLLADPDQTVRSAAQNFKLKPRKYIPIKTYYSIAMSKEEEISPDLIVLDANVILDLETWAREDARFSTFGDLNESLKPVLKVIRACKFVSFEQGVIESSWPSPKKVTENAGNLVNVNKSRVHELLNLMNFLRTEEAEIFEPWINSERQTSITWGKEIQDKVDFENSKVRILENWLICALLIDYIVRIEESEAIVDIQQVDFLSRIEYYKRFLDSLNDSGLEIEGEMLFLTRMGFFGGRIRFQDKSFGFDEISKKKDWQRRGTLAIARNIAMDVALIRVARDLRLMGGKKMNPKTAIITGDLGLLALFQYITSENVLVAEGRTSVTYEWPPNSDFTHQSFIFQAAGIATDPMKLNFEKDFDDSWILQELMKFN